jgi:beta-lactamase class A
MSIFSRRAFSLVLITICLVVSFFFFTEKSATPSSSAKFEQLELSLSGHIGVFAINTATGDYISYRADERFPLCSTFKALLAAAFLKRSEKMPDLLNQKIKYSSDDIVEYSPITEQHLEEGMTISELCAASVQYSDNTAANLLMKELGGPEAVTAFARSISNNEFRLDRWETELNTAIPGDARDTATPRSMAHSLLKLSLQDGLGDSQRQQLNEWLIGNTTGASRIRAGIPEGWLVGDKTGGGSYGTSNDIAVIWPLNRAPVIISIYSTQNDENAKPRNDLVASATRIVVDWINQSQP